jgi:hypothetical protein
VVRDHVKEGTRCYFAYNRPDYVSSRLFPSLATVAHKPGYRGAPGTEQDVWVLRRGAASRRRSKIAIASPTASRA